MVTWYFNHEKRLFLSLSLSLSLSLFSEAWKTLIRLLFLIFTLHRVCQIVLSSSQKQLIINFNASQILTFTKTISWIIKFLTFYIPWSNHVLVTDSENAFCVCVCVCVSIIISRYQHGYSWPSLATPPDRPLLQARPQGYIPYWHRPAVCRFKLVILPFSAFLCNCRQAFSPYI